MRRRVLDGGRTAEGVALNVNAARESVVWISKSGFTHAYEGLSEICVGTSVGRLCGPRVIDEEEKTWGNQGAHRVRVGGSSV